MVETLAKNDSDFEDSAWNVLDVELEDYDSEVLSTDDERSEAELEYEKNEKILKNAIFHANDTRNDDLVERVDEIHGIFSENNHAQTDEIDQALKKLVGGFYGSETASLEALFDYVDSKFPSPFVEREEPEQPERKEDDYRHAMMREGLNNEENLEELAKIFTKDGSMKDLHIGQTLRVLGESSAEERNAFSTTLVEYLKDMSDKNREKLTRLQSNHEGVLSNSLFNIAATFDESKTPVGEKMLNPTILMATSAIKGSEEIFGGIMKYLRFKIANSKR